MSKSTEGDVVPAVAYQWKHTDPLSGNTVWRPREYWNGNRSTERRALYSRPMSTSEADEIIDQLNVICEDFGCEPGSNRLFWLHDQLSELTRLRTENEALREALTLAEAVLSNAPEFETTAGGRIPLTKVSEARDVARAALKEPCGWPDEFDPEAV